MPLSPPLNAADFRSGSWEEDNDGNSLELREYDCDRYDWYSSNIRTSFGYWESSNSNNYGGWWWSSDNDISFNGIDWDGSAVGVLDANSNGLYDNDDYVLGYAYGNGNNGNSGTWQRNANDFTGTFLGGSFGVFEIVVPLKYSGTERKENIVGSNLGDTISVKQGRDVVDGRGGNDVIDGGGGNDTLNGGLGNDKLIGGSGIDTAVFSNLRNTINLGTTRRQNTREGKDILRQIENVNGGGGKDTIKGSRGNNTLNGGSEADKLYGKASADKLYGEDGKDKLYGGSANDQLYGEDGNDILTGGIGIDKLWGGDGRDTFEINTGVGHDVVKDFSEDNNDRIKLLTGKSDVNLIKFGNHVKVKYEGDLMAIIENMTTAELDQDGAFLS